MARALLLLSAWSVVAACGDSPDGLRFPDAEPRPPAPDAAPVPDAPPVFSDLVLRGTFDLAIAADVAASPARDLVAISEWFSGAVSLIDVSDPANPARVARIEDIDYNADVQIKGDRLYVNHEPVEKGGSAPIGIRVFDISNPAAPVQTGTVGEEAGHPGLVSCHNLWPQPDRELLYCASSFSGQVLVLSTGEGGTGTPDAPVFIDAIDSPGNDCNMAHDMYARGTTLYIAWLCDGFAIYDTTTPTIPVRKAQHVYPGAFTHNLWPSDDGGFLFTTDEVIGGHVRVFDIRDYEAIEQVGEFSPNPKAIVHNVEVAGDRAYVAFYTQGTYALDVSDPTEPLVIGEDDFYDGPEGTERDPFPGLRGAWGVEPNPPYVYVSNTDGGLRIYELE